MSTATATTATTPNSNASEPAFVLVTANTCRHCVDFKSNHWAGVKAYLEENKIRVFDYAVPSMGERNALTVHHPTAPLHIRTKISFYPTLMLVEGSSWDRAAASPNSDIPLLAEVYGAEMSSAGRYVPSGAPPITVDNVTNWIKTCRNKASFQPGSQPAGTTQPNTNTAANATATNANKVIAPRPPMQVQQAARPATSAPAVTAPAAAKPSDVASSSSTPPAPTQQQQVQQQQERAPPMVLRQSSNGSVQLETGQKHRTFEAVNDNVCKYGYFTKRV